MLRGLSVRTQLVLTMVSLAVASVALTVLFIELRTEHPEGASALRQHIGLERALVEVGLLTGALALFGAVIIALRFTRPLHGAAVAAKRMAAGELVVHADAPGPRTRELSELLGALDDLGSVLREEEGMRHAALADATHELRGGLVPLLARVEALADGVGDPVLTLDKLHVDVLRLTRLVDDMRALAADRPQVRLEVERLDVGDLLRERVDAWAPRFREQDVALMCSAGSAPVVADPDRLDQVLDNLLSNALRYTDPGGIVRVRTTALADRAVLEVADTGIGIPAEHRQRVFERFVRLPEARFREGEGTGVGLAVVADLMHVHGGAVTVDETPGGGSTFTAWLPLATRVTAPPRSRPGAGSAPAAG
jgi:two-component system, OmpR family, sensor histidine kinase BaeS